MTNMSRKITFQTAADSAAKEGAAYWLATLSDSSCSEAERKAFIQWLRSSTANVNEFLQLSAAVRSTARRELWPEEDLEVLIGAARAESNVAQFTSPARDGAAEKARRSARPVAIAASILGAIALGLIAFTNENWIERLTSTYSTEVGEQRSIALEDGSLIELNSRSRLRTRFSEGLRAIEMLEGEAIFRVAKDPARPFRVRTGVSDIVALGTAFNVNATDSRTVITVLEGKVRVNERKKAGSAAKLAGSSLEGFELAPGEQLTVSLEMPVVRVSLPDTDRVTSWTERRLIFEGTPIASAAVEFARYSPKQITILDERLGQRQITGVFDATDPESLVQFLASDETVQVQQSGAGWTVALKDGGRRTADGGQ